MRAVCVSELALDLGRLAQSGRCRYQGGVFGFHDHGDTHGIPGRKHAFLAQRSDTLAALTAAVTPSNNGTNGQTQTAATTGLTAPQRSLLYFSLSALKHLGLPFCITRWSENGCDKKVFEAI